MPETYISLCGMFCYTDQCKYFIQMLYVIIITCFIVNKEHHHYSSSKPSVYKRCKIYNTYMTMIDDIIINNIGKELPPAIHDIIIKGEIK